MQTSEEFRKQLANVSHSITGETKQENFERIVKNYLDSKKCFLELHGSKNKDDSARGLFVKQGAKIYNKELIFKFTPFMQITDPSNDTNCSYCFSYIHTKGYACQKCQTRSYCSFECKEKDECGFHNVECELIRDKQCDIITLSALKLLHLLSTNNEMLTLCRNLSSHFRIFLGWFLGGTILENIHVELFEQIKSYIGLTMKKVIGGDPDMKGVFKCILLIIVNAVTMSNSYDENIGLMFDPVIALINHSCYDRNCSLGWMDGKEVCLHSINNIGSDKELFFSYCPVTIPVDIRQRILSSSFFFRCQCAMCNSSVHKGEEWIPVVCPLCRKENKSRMFNLKTFFEYTDASHLQKETVTCAKCNNEFSVVNTWDSYRKLIWILLGGTVKDGEVRQVASCHQLEIPQEISTGLDTSCIDSNNMEEIKHILTKSIQQGVSWKSWPMQIIANALLQAYQAKDPESFDVVKLTVITNSVGSSIEGLRGMCYYNIAVAYERWLQYQRRESNQIETELCLALVARAYRRLWEETATVTSPMKDLLAMAKNRQKWGHHNSIAYMKENQIQQLICKFNRKCSIDGQNVTMEIIDGLKVNSEQGITKESIYSIKRAEKSLKSDSVSVDDGNIFQVLLK